MVEAVLRSSVGYARNSDREMRPVDDETLTTILAALAATAGTGALDGTREIAKSTVTAGASKFWGLLQDRLRLRGDEVGLTKLEELAREPDEGKLDGLKPHLLAAGLVNDLEVSKLAATIVESISRPTAYGAGAVALGHLDVSDTKGGTIRIGGVDYSDRVAGTQVDPS